MTNRPGLTYPAKPLSDPKPDSAFTDPLWLAFTRRVLKEVAEGKSA